MKFRRQHPIGRYILDFYCESARLAIELDGGGHTEEGQAQHDARRTEELERLGIRVVRFWNTDVLFNVEGVLQRILEMAESPSPSPSPSPPARGRGERRLLSPAPPPSPHGRGLG